jgi:hypothetical protein|tara:strand:- start:3972 stop:4139 length:168 start_codon:yes stop_codon:yes gene_type:complete
MKNIVWNYLSSFGIMFAILSWLQESELFFRDFGYKKGLLAAILGFALYKIIGSKV